MYQATTIIRTAIDDLVGAATHWHLWSVWGWNDIKKRYRRSALGPVWASLSLGIFVSALGLLYAQLLGVEPAIYMPHLILGLVVWNLISSVIIESCRIFESSHTYIKDLNTPISVFICVLMWRNLILFSYQFIVFIIAAFVIPIQPEPSWFFAPFGLMVIIVNLTWIALLFALISTRYHDFIEIVGNIIRIMFFLTPIIWLPDRLGDHDFLLNINPFYHFIEVFRAYLIGTDVNPISWPVVLTSTVIGWAISIYAYGRYKDRIAYWV